MREFKGMVKALHAAGLEVILDVVYNHTGEGNHLGPMLSFKGVDNASYYRLVPDDPRYYMDFTGTGNSLNPVHPSVLRLIMDSLRYFAMECHVDGFRFDLASALAREFYDVDRLASFFDVIHQDPVLSQVKLIAEPWDVGPGGYQVGNFPVLWTEWNGLYRDTMRDFWRGGASVADFATRVTGSSDLYQSDGRTPYASINFITAHDGFTLWDLTSYNEKHNEANGEDNRDGTDDNRSWNCGVEGETDDPEINALRMRQRRNFLTTLFLSQGVPMLLGGDEIGRTQRGNNNAWCQDNELSWFDWELDDERRGAARLHAAAHPLPRRAPGVPARALPRGRAGRRLAAARRLVVPPRRPPHDAPRLAVGGRAPPRRVPERRGDHRPDAGRRARSPTTRSSCSSTRFHEPVVFTLPPPRFGRALDARALDGRRRGRASVPGARPRAARGRARPSCCARGCERRLALHLPAPARAGPRLPARARARPVPARARRQPPLPLAVAAGARPARRTATTSPTRRASPTTSAARPRSASSARPGSASLLDIVPNHMATVDENPFWADPELRAKFFDWDPETGWHRRFFTIDALAGVRVEDPEVFEDDARQGARARAARGSSTACASTTRTGSPTRASTSSGSRERGVRHVWVEKILEPGEQLRDWPVEGTTGYEFANDVTALFVDPAGEEPLTELYAELTGERAASRRSRRSRSSTRRTTSSGPSSSGCARCATAPGSRRRPRRCRCTGPTSSRTWHGSRRPTVRRSSSCPTTCAVRSCSRSRRRPSS